MAHLFLISDIAHFFFFFVLISDIAHLFFQALHLGSLTLLREELRQTNLNSIIATNLSFSND